MHTADEPVKTAGRDREEPPMREPAKAIPPMDPAALLALPRRDARGPLVRVGISANRGGHTRELCAGCAVAAARWMGAADSPYRLELVWEEDSFDAAGARLAATRLVEAGCAVVVGHLSSSAALPASEVYHRAGVPYLAPGTTHPDLAARGLWNVLQVCGRDDDLADTMARVAAARGRRRAAIVWQEITYGRALSGLLRRSLLERGVEVVAMLPWRDDLSAADAAALRRSDALLFAGTYQAGASLARWLRAMGHAGLVIMGDDALIDELPIMAASAVEGVRVVSTRVDEAHPDHVAFHRDYVARAGLSPGAYAATSHEAMRLVLESLPVLASEGPVAFLASVRARGASRPTMLGKLQFTAEGRLSAFPWQVYRIEEGQFVAEDIKED